MAFRFGFGDGEADDKEDVEHDRHSHHEGVPANGGVNTEKRPVKEHSLEELLNTLPERISYSTVEIESPTGRIIHLPRRELYDVRVQLLSEGDSSNDAVVDQLEKSDLRSGVYEGGFKTWECSIDLASLLLDRGPRKDIDDLIRCAQVVELGAGTALPSLVLFRHALLNAIPLTFVFQDYNDEVLRLVTLCNILLTWAANTQYNDFPTPNLERTSQGDLELTPDLISRFIAEMKCKDINFIFLSGPWSRTLANLIPASAPDLGLVVLAAETIYDPQSTADFVDLVVTLLRRVKMGKAMIGAKKVYFGVGGSVDGLKAACREKAAVAYEIENHGVPGMDGGVGRALIEVQMM